MKTQTKIALKDHTRTLGFGALFVASLSLTIWIFSVILSFATAKAVFAILYLGFVALILVYGIGFVIRIAIGEIN